VIWRQREAAESENHGVPLRARPALWMSFLPFKAYFKDSSPRGCSAVAPEAFRFGEAEQKEGLHQGGEKIGKSHGCRVFEVHQEKVSWP